MDDLDVTLAYLVCHRYGATGRLRNLRGPEVLRQKYWQGRTNATIAHALGISPTRVGQIVACSLRCLRSPWVRREVLGLAPCGVALHEAIFGHGTHRDDCHEHHLQNARYMTQGHKEPSWLNTPMQLTLPGF